MSRQQVIRVLGFDRLLRSFEKSGTQIENHAVWLGDARATGRRCEVGDGATGEFSPVAASAPRIVEVLVDKPQGCSNLLVVIMVRDPACLHLCSPFLQRVGVAAERCAGCCLTSVGLRRVGH